MSNSPDPFSQPTTDAHAEDEIAPALDFQEFKGSVAVEPIEEEYTDRDKLMESEPTAETEGEMEPQFTTGFFRSLFDVDTKEVLHRILWTVWPLRRSTAVPFLQEGVDKPDLYGPLWISTTLIFFMAVTGNFASYVAWRSQLAPDDPSKPPSATWQYDFNKVTIAAILIYGYVFIISLFVWFGWKRLGAENLGFFATVCFWGYAMLPFIPASVLCIFNSDAVRWIVVLAAGLMSFWFLVTQLRPHVHETKSFVALAVVLGVHAAFTIAAKLYFFSYS